MLQFSLVTVRTTFSSDFCKISSCNPLPWSVEQRLRGAKFMSPGQRKRDRLERRIFEQSFERNCRRSLEKKRQPASTSSLALDRRKENLSQNCKVIGDERKETCQTLGLSSRTPGLLDLMYHYFFGLSLCCCLQNVEGIQHSCWEANTSNTSIHRYFDNTTGPSSAHPEQCHAHSGLS